MHRACFRYADRGGGWCFETAFGCRLDSWSASLDLGSGAPVTKRVSAASSLLAIAKSSIIRLSVHDLSACLSDSGANLFLGVAYNSHSLGESLDCAATARNALAAYETVDVAKRAGRGANTKSIAERFGALSEWSLTALGSNGAVWSDGSVSRIHKHARFGASEDVPTPVSLVIDYERNELRAIIHGREVALVRKLMPRRIAGQPAPRLYVVAQLTDVHRSHPIVAPQRACVRVAWHGVDDLT